MKPATTTPSPALPLSQLLDGISALPLQADPTITGLSLDSRQVEEGCLFFAYPGAATDGRDYIGQALQQGAAVVLYEPHPDIRPSEHCIPLINVQQHIGRIAARFWGNDRAELTMIGITGTNGKSTCTYWLSHAIAASGRRCALIGTIGVGEVGHLQPAKLTTPDPVSLNRDIASFVAAGVNTIVMEVSSHALAQHRVSGIPFKLAAFTNLSHEHLDYHGTMREYAAAKAKLFDFETLDAAVINAGDEVGALWLSNMAKPYRLIATTSQPETALPAHVSRVMASHIQSLPTSHQSFQLSAENYTDTFTIPAVGRFNNDNALTCAALLRELGWSWEAIKNAIAELPSVPGRMQTLQGESTALVVVDYAHTPDALESALRSLREVCLGQLFCVFGCGGDRDQAKRPVMGSIAARFADSVTITDDNPRSEAPSAIANAIIAGMGDGVEAPYISDREKAIDDAIKRATADDVILVAGKGHETTQTQGGVANPFDDVAVIQALLETR